MSQPSVSTQVRRLESALGPRSWTGRLHGRKLLDGEIARMLRKLREWPPDG